MRFSLCCCRSAIVVHEMNSTVLHLPLALFVRWRTRRFFKESVADMIINVTDSDEKGLIFRKRISEFPMLKEIFQEVGKNAQGDTVLS
jgi:hypothetical protein